VRSVIEFFWQFLLGITSAVGFAALIVGGVAFGIGCAVCGCGYTWRKWRQRLGRPPE
jgi:hypothetical protein